MKGGSKRHCWSSFNAEWLFLLPTFIPLSRPNFFHMLLLSRLVRGLPTGDTRSPIGGLVGGVIGLSFVGLGVLSSVIPGALPEPDALIVISEVPEVAEAKGAMTLGFDGEGEGAEAVGERRILNLALCSVVVRVEGADLRFSIEGAE